MTKQPLPNSREAIAAAWERLCDEYAADLTRPNKRGGLAAIELAAIRKELAGRVGLRILDAGCGPGRHGVRLALDEHTVVMTDVSARMLEAAHAAAAEAGVSEKVTVVEDDIRESALESGSFDAIISCGTVVSDCGDPAAAISELARLLKDGGLALFSVRNLREWPNGSEPARKLVPQGHQAFDWVFISPQGLKASCRDAGMVLERIYPVGVVDPPEEEEGIESYVQFHIDLLGDSPALSTAHELFATARK